MSFCALCTAETSDLVDWNDDGKRYRICRGCNDEMAVANDGPDRGYPIPEGGGSQESICANATAILGKRGKLRFHNDINKNLGERTPGWILVRVPLKGRDRHEVLDTLRGEPWFSELRVLGTTRHYHLFERPDPAVASEQRRQSVNPLAAIEQYRTEAG